MRFLQRNYHTVERQGYIPSRVNREAEGVQDVMLQRADRMFGALVLDCCAEFVLLRF